MGTLESSIRREENALAGKLASFQAYDCLSVVKRETFVEGKNTLEYIYGYVNIDWISKVYNFSIAVER